MTTITIDGAQARLMLRQGKHVLDYQPRNAEGEFLWLRWYRDHSYDGWTYDTEWAPEADHPVFGHDMSPCFGSEPIGWTPLQIGKATVWASDKLDYTRQIALKYGAAAQ